MSGSLASDDGNGNRSVVPCLAIKYSRCSSLMAGGVSFISSRCSKTRLFSKFVCVIPDDDVSQRSIFVVDFYQVIPWLYTGMERRRS